MEKVELTILMPCLNEAKTLSICIQKAKGYLKSKKINGEILIADNGSSDDSQKIAKALGARVINIKKRGYGAALLGGIGTAKGKYIIMADSDDSYDFSNLAPFMKKLRAGFDFVMGNRFKGEIKKGAMPLSHRYIGNPILTKIGQILFNTPVGDFHSGLRGFDKSKILALNLSSPGMEFASEMLIKASLKKLKICEVPITLSKDGRERKPHLRTWRDGFRHLKILLTYSPQWIFMYPGIFFLIIGSILGSLLLIEPLNIGGISLETHTMLYSFTAIIIGLDLLAFAKVSEKIQELKGIVLKKTNANNNLNSFEIFFFGGLVSIFLGLGTTVLALYLWGETGFADLNITDTMRVVIPSVTFLTIGIKFIFLAFLFDNLDKES